MAFVGKMREDFGKVLFNAWEVLYQSYKTFGAEETMQKGPKMHWEAAAQTCPAQALSAQGLGVERSNTIERSRW